MCVETNFGKHQKVLYRFVSDRAGACGFDHSMGGNICNIFGMGEQKIWATQYVVVSCILYTRASLSEGESLPNLSSVIFTFHRSLSDQLSSGD